MATRNPRHPVQEGSLMPWSLSDRQARKRDRTSLITQVQTLCDYHRSYAMRGLRQAASGPPTPTQPRTQTPLRICRERHPDPLLGYFEFPDRQTLAALFTRTRGPLRSPPRIDPGSDSAVPALGDERGLPRSLSRRRTAVVGGQRTERDQTRDAPQTSNSDPNLGSVG